MKTKQEILVDHEILYPHEAEMLFNEDILFRNFKRILEDAMEEYARQRDVSKDMYSDVKAIDLVNSWKSESVSPDKDIIDEAIHEREALFQAFDKIRASFEGRHWLMEGRGCYPYDDERYKQEVRYIMDEFEEINTNLWKQINSKSFEYRDMIKAPLEVIIQKQEELIEFYAERLAANAMFLHIHHVDETSENCEKGKRLRKELNDLKTK
jgi:hypothetical protein